jgi:hypothetical protein
MEEWTTPRPGCFTAGKQNRHQLYMRLCGTQGRSGRCGKPRPPPPPPGLGPSTVQPRSESRYPGPEREASELNVRTVHCLIGYNRPTLCTDYWLSLLYLLLRLLYVSALMCHLQGASFILVSYLKVRNGCVIGMYPCTVNVGGLCAPDVVVSCITVSSWAHSRRALTKVVGIDPRSSIQVWTRLILFATLSADLLLESRCALIKVVGSDVHECQYRLELIPHRNTAQRFSECSVHQNMFRIKPLGTPFYWLATAVWQFQ